MQHSFKFQSIIRNIAVAKRVAREFPSTPYTPADPPIVCDGVEILDAEEFYAKPRDGIGTLYACLTKVRDIETGKTKVRRYFRGCGDTLAIQEVCAREAGEWVKGLSL